MARSEPNILLVWGQYPRWIQPIHFSNNQVTLAANLKTKIKSLSSLDFSYFENFQPNGWLENGSFDLFDYCERHNLGTNYDFIIVYAEQDAGLFPLNVRSFNCPTILLVGDTHHFPRPISSLLDYVIKERFDAVVIQFTGHHLHWVRDAGVANCGFIPGLITSPTSVPWNDSRIENVAFVGHAWKYHNYRSYLLDYMKRSGVPCDIKVATREEAAETYATSLISFNCSLNCDINIRNFEVLASGGLLLTDSLPAATGFPALFLPGEACEVYGDQEELISKIVYYQAHPDAALRVARRGLDHFFEKLTPEQAILKFKSSIFWGGDLEALTPEDERCLRPSRANLAVRLNAYEEIQELHRQQLSVKVLVGENKSWFRADDFIDMPRVQLYSTNKNIDHRVTAIDPVVVAKTAWDYVV